MLQKLKMIVWVLGAGVEFCTDQACVVLNGKRTKKVW